MRVNQVSYATCLRSGIPALLREAGRGGMHDKNPGPLICELRSPQLRVVAIASSALVIRGLYCRPCGLLCRKPASGRQVLAIAGSTARSRAFRSSALSAIVPNGSVGDRLGDGAAEVTGREPPGNAVWLAAVAKGKGGCSRARPVQQPEAELTMRNSTDRAAIARRNIAVEVG